MDNNTKYPTIRIESLGNVGYNTFVNGILINKVIQTEIDINSCPKKATIEFDVDVEPIEFEGEVEKTMITFVDGVKYKLVEMEE